MKTKFALITLLLACTLKSYASGGEENTKKSKAVAFEIKDQIARAINQPLPSMHLMGDKELILDFYVNSENKLIINGIETSNGFLAAEVSKMLNGHKIYTRPERKNQAYRLKIKFVE